MTKKKQRWFCDECNKPAWAMYFVESGTDDYPRCSRDYYTIADQIKVAERYEVSGKIELISLGQLEHEVAEQDAQPYTVIKVLCEECSGDFTGYELDTDGLTTSREAWSWLHHLLGKNWFRGSEARAFIDRISKALNIQIHPLTLKD